MQNLAFLASWRFKSACITVAAFCPPTSWVPAGALPAQEPDVRVQRFDRDPGWDGRNNRSATPEAREVRQAFGYQRTARAGGQAGEIGGFVTPAAEPAYYAKAISPRTLAQPLSASGTLVVGPGETPGNVLVGFFNAGTLNEWRTPNTIALRLNSRGTGFHAHVEYATSRWRAGADFLGAVDPASGKKQARELPNGAVHRWSLRYDPAGNGGGGTVTATFDGETVVQNLEPGHKADGATFNRFGILNVLKSVDSGGTLYLDDLTINGEAERFDSDPAWEGRGNQATFLTKNIRPRFDFGYSATRHAGGAAAGEIGGLFFRGDERYPERMAYYGDRLESLSLEGPLRAAGKVSLHRGVSDSTTLLGFFHAQESMRRSDAQRSGFPENFLGAAIEGPSRDGFCFYACYGTDQEGETGHGLNERSPRIYPDAKPHDWSLEYLPGTGGGGRINVTFDGQAAHLDLTPAHRATGARFNRFGFVTTHIDGNAQIVYLDDLKYTWRQ